MINRPIPSRRHPRALRLRAARAGHGLALVALVGLTAACGSSTSPRSFDQRFLDLVGPTHEAVREMAKVAESRAMRPALRELAARIVHDANREITMVRTWRRQWFSASVPPPLTAVPMLPGLSGLSQIGHPMRGGTMDYAREIARLDQSQSFDDRFIALLASYDRLVIEAAKLGALAAEHPEIGRFAEQAIAEHTSNLRELLDLRT